MIFQPAILSLLLASLLTTLALGVGGAFAVRILRHWDPSSGAAAQLRLERGTYLASTLVGFALVVQGASLIQFVFNADRMASQFVGAMCAAGTLRVNAFGMPALMARVAAFFAAALWLAVDHLDKQGHDYPLIRVKYALLLAILPLTLGAAGLDLAYFLNLRADVVTSCCSRLFTPANDGLSGDLAALDPAPALGLLFGGLAVVLVLGGVLVARGAGRGNWVAWAFSGANALFFVLGMAAIISVVSLYVYENPNHHCPFCLLKPEYGYVGYALHGPLFLATATGLAVGPLAWARRFPSLAISSPRSTRTLALVAMGALALFGAGAGAIIFRSGLVLFP
jgi:hypothetical protein